jgi:hypothetical protein
MTALTQGSAKSLTALRALQQAVTKALDKKQRLGQYSVVWKNGQPVLTGADAPKGK